MAPKCPSCGFAYGVAAGSCGDTVCTHCGENITQTYPDWAIDNEEPVMNIPWDCVQLTIVEHESVPTDTVRVSVRATLSVTPEQADRAKSTLADALAGVIDAKWEISRALRREDASGMERLVAIATVRVKESAAAGLGAKLQHASRSGFKLELADIEYRPPREALDAAKGRLRAAVYKRAVEEAAVLNGAIADDTRAWEVNDIKIEDRVEDNRLRENMGFGGRAAEAMMMSSSRSYSSMRADGGGSGGGGDEGDESADFSVGNRVVVTGRVTLRRPSLRPPEGGFFGGNRGHGDD